MRVLLAAVALLTFAAVASGQDKPSRLPAGSTIAGVAVGDLGPKRTKAALMKELGQRYERRVFVRGRGRRLILGTSRLGQVIHYDRMVKAAFAAAAKSNGAPVSIRLDRSLERGKLRAAIGLVGARIDKPARNASVRLGLLRPSIRKPRNGLAVDRVKLRRALVAEVLRPNETRLVRVSLVRVRPRIGVNRLRSIYGTYISIDRSSFRLRLFKRLRRVRTYGVAVGQAGYGTPGGLFRVRSKDWNPAWHVPNSPWAGSLRGQTIPPGDPRNPLRVVFMSLGGAIGIHGTSEPWSIGTRASHGCIRMRSGDVRNLANRTPVGTPVLIR
ncbi:MAG: L,D-transpeptidase/peptidoglycan binding protein [Actinomycetota bacterium]|nr:L,D-transpeptidase/peptidoglycan binding protein [Actinomycetota bacterium]